MATVKKKPKREETPPPREGHQLARSPSHGWRRRTAGGPFERVHVHRAREARRTSRTRMGNSSRGHCAVHEPAPVVVHVDGAREAGADAMHCAVSLPQSGAATHDNHRRRPVPHVLSLCNPRRLDAPVGESEHAAPARRGAHRRRRRLRSSSAPANRTSSPARRRRACAVRARRTTYRTARSPVRRRIGEVSRRGRLRISSLNPGTRARDRPPHPA